MLIGCKKASFLSRLKSRVHLTTTTDIPDVEHKEPQCEERCLAAPPSDKKHGEHRLEEEKRVDGRTSHVEHQL